MPIKTACPSCEQVYTLADNLVGKKVKCKSCNNPFTVEEAKKSRGPDEEPRKSSAARTDPDDDDGGLFDRARKRNKDRTGAEDDEDDRPARRRSRADEDDEYEDDRPARRRSRAEVDEDEDDRPRRNRSRDDDEDDRPERPRKRKKARGGMPVWAWILIGVGGLFVLGFVILVAVLVIGGSAINADNFAKLKTGMTEAEVKAILGSPTESLNSNMNQAGLGGLRMLGGTNALGWKSGDNEIAVIFNNGKLVQKFGKFGTTTRMGGNRMF